MNDAYKDIFTRLLVYIWKFKHTEISVYKPFDNYLINSSMYGDVNYSYSYFMSETKKNDKFDVKILTFVPQQLIQELGFAKVKKGKFYYKKQIKDICVQSAKDGSWDVIRDITAILRLANRDKEEVDINNLHLYYRMYYRRKDPSVYYLPEVLHLSSFYVNRKRITQHISWIDKLQEMSEKGIREIYCNYLNLCSPKHIRILRKLDGFNPDKHKLFVGWLSTELLNQMTSDEVIKIFMYNLSSYRPSISSSDLRSVSQSIHN